MEKVALDPPYLSVTTETLLHGNGKESKEV